VSNRQAILGTLKWLLEGIAALRPIRIFSIRIAAGSWGGICRYGLATRWLWQRDRGAETQRGRSGNGTQRQEEMGALPLGAFQVLATEFHESAGHSIAQSVWARAHHQQQRERVKQHHAAVRALAFA